MNRHNKVALHYTRLERLASDKHSSLLGPLVSYKENEVVLIRLLEYNLEGGF